MTIQTTRTALPTDASAASAGNAASLTLFLAIGSFTPSFVFFVFGASSGAAGLMVAAILLVFALLIGVGRVPSTQDVANAAVVAALGLVFLVAHGSVAGLMNAPDVGRAALSAVSIAFMLFAAIVSAPTLFGASDKATDRATNIIRGMFLLIAVASLLGIQPPALLLERPIFPFTEPSHYALAFAPLLVDGCVRSRPIVRWLLLAAGFVIGYLLQSLSLVVAVTLAAAICLPVFRLGILAVVGVVAIAGLQLLDINYFAERVSSDAGSQNISRLVYVQGWELVQRSLADTSGWGVGFQQLGFAPVDSPTADQLYRLLGTDANLKDGGFTAAKIISEFGVFGIVGITMLLFIMTRAVIRLRNEAIHPGELSAGQVLAYSMTVAYLIEMFVRGIGYFSGTTMLLFAALFYNRVINIQRKGVQ